MAGTQTVMSLSVSAGVGRCGRGGADEWVGAERDNLHQLIGDVLQQCQDEGLEGFPPPRATIPSYDVHKIKEITWALAESNFRFECLSLDVRASGLTRLEEVRACFVGQVLLRIPLEYSTRGPASETQQEHHRAIGRAACAQEPLAYTNEEMSDLEWAVACYYTQSFYEYFGRAAVVPMRLKNDWSKFSNWPQST
ncbi:hypothetical protein DFH09DRAFT_1097968 [Mycena vulgaris]|nr:hypothetical protein DFH09DRAFT_1097968 [Mycena vulgaris]